MTTARKVKKDKIAIEKPEQPDGSMEDLSDDDLNGEVDIEWRRRMNAMMEKGSKVTKQKSSRRKPRKQIVIGRKAAAGNMEGLAKHLGKKLGGDPHFFSKCVASAELAKYDEEARKGICAKAHKLVTGIYPGEHGGKNKTGMG